MNRLKKYSAMIFDFLFPLVSVWLIVAYIRFLVYLRMDLAYNLTFLFILFIPAAFAEYFFSIVFYRRAAGRTEKTLKLESAARILLWFFLFFMWVIAMPMEPALLRWLKFFHFSFFPMIGMVYLAESYWTGIAAVLWLVTYIHFTAICKRSRIFNSAILPLFLTSLLFQHYYFMGGIGAHSSRRIGKQPGVEIFYGPGDFPRIDYFQHREWTRDLHNFPRDVYIDAGRNALYANYADTYGKSSGKKTPSVIKIDMDTKETHYFMSHYARAMGTAPDSLFISPWFVNSIYELDKDTLDIKRVIPAQTGIYPWETIGIYYDREGRRLFVSNDMSPALFRYDYENGKMTGDLQPGYFKYGGTLWNVQHSEKTGMLYLIGFGAEDDLFEVDPDTMKIVRSLNLHTPGGSSLLLDDEGGRLFFQDGGSNDLYEIDIESFKVIRTYRGKVHSRRMYLDRKRDSIYLASYFYGTLTALDLATGSRVWEIKVGGKPYGLAVSGNTAYVNSMAGIVKIDLDTVWNSKIDGR